MAAQLADHMHPSPVDENVLYIQRHHCSEAVWQNRPDRLLRIRRTTTMGHVPTSNARLMGYLQQAGFAGVAEVGFIPMDWHLISALVERWRPETHTFHFTTGEASITLQDVEVLLGLRVDGKPVTGCSKDNWEFRCRQLLGVTPRGRDTLRGQLLSIQWLHQHLGLLEDGADVNDETVQQHARAYILGLMAGILFLDKSNSRVHLVFLPLLIDFETAGNYSWGSACLSWLYRELCRATDYNAHEFGGCQILLQLWAWERLPMLAPIPKALHVLDRPLGCRWRDAKYDSNASHNLPHYRMLLDRQRLNQIIWEPYNDELMASLPDYCTRGRGIWRSMVPLIVFHIIEWHQPDKVLRQFGMQQPIPLRPNQDDSMHTIDLRGRHETNWGCKHVAYIQLWQQRAARVVSYPPQLQPLTLDSEYMRWYWQITRRWVSPIGATLKIVAEGVDLMVQRGSSEVREIDKILLMCMNEQWRLHPDRRVDEVPDVVDLPELPTTEPEIQKRTRRLTSLTEKRQNLRPDEYDRGFIPPEYIPSSSRVQRHTEADQDNSQQGQPEISHACTSSPMASAGPSSASFTPVAILRDLPSSSPCFTPPPSIPEHDLPDLSSSLFTPVPVVIAPHPSPTTTRDPRC